MTTMAKDKFFNRRRSGIDQKAMDMVLTEARTGNTVQVAIIYKHGNETSYFLSHPHLDLWPPSIQDLKETSIRNTTMDSCNQTEQQRNLMVQWRQQQGLPLLTTECTAPSHLEPPPLNAETGSDPGSLGYFAGCDIFSTDMPLQQPPVAKPSPNHVETDDEDEENSSDENDKSSSDEDESEERSKHALIRYSPKRRRLDDDARYTPGNSGETIWHGGHIPMPPAGFTTSQPDAMYVRNGVASNPSHHPMYNMVASQGPGEMYSGNGNMFKMYMGAPQGTPARTLSMPERSQDMPNKERGSRKKSRRGSRDRRKARK